MKAPRFERISDYVEHWASRNPQREALIGDRARWSYRDLQRDVDRCAAALLATGVRSGDRVALLGNPRPECFIVFLACAGIGAIWVGLNTRYTVTELEQVIADSEPVVIFGMLDPEDASHAERLAAIRAVAPVTVVTRARALPGLSIGYDEFLDRGDGDRLAQLSAARALVAGSDPVAMIYTSGSTGTPKGALIPTGGLAYCGAVQAGRWYGEATRKLCDLPLNHIGGLGDICSSVLVAGGTVAFMERFDAAGALRLTERERLTNWYFIPTQLLAMVATPQWATTDLRSLEWIVWGGAAAPGSLLETLADVGAHLGTSYSLTESVGSVTYTDPEDPLDVLTWSVGRVDPHYDVRLAGRDGESVAAGEPGEILIRGDFITRGYFRDPEATRATIDADGWLHTGDLAREEHGGHIRLVGRLKELFKSGGFNVYPREVEMALERHPAVALAAVVAAPDERWGEVGHAFIVPREQVSADELVQHARSQLANYKVPKVFWVEEELPKLPVGKVDKVALRRRVAEHVPAQRSAHGGP